MRLDHVVYAAEPDGLDATARRLGELVGVPFVDGGFHPRFGTVNKILPLAGGHYVEIVAVLDHPAADKVPFGQAIKARTECGGGWVAWCVAVPDIAVYEARLGRRAVLGNRRRPDGYELRWHQLGVADVRLDPQLPFFVSWDSDPAEHPSKGATGEVDLAKVELAGDPHRVTEWLGGPASHPLDDVEVEWLAHHGVPGIMALHFRTPKGLVRI